MPPWNDSIAFSENVEKLNQFYDERGSRYFTLSNSILFVCSVITTVGYGSPSPLTKCGKVLCIVVVLLGIPVSIGVSTRLTEYIMQYIRKLNTVVVVFIANHLLKLKKHCVNNQSCYPCRKLNDEDKQCSNYGDKEEFQSSYSEQQNNANPTNNVVFSLRSTSSLSIRSTCHVNPSAVGEQLENHDKYPNKFDKTLQLSRKNRDTIIHNGETSNFKQNFQLTSWKWYFKKNCLCGPFSSRVFDIVHVSQMIALASLVITILFLTIILPAVAFYFVEKGWDYLDSVYVALISLSTVGLGDMVPSSQYHSDSKKTIYEISLSLYLVLGNVFFMVMLRAYQETYVHFKEEIHDRLNGKVNADDEPP